MLPTRGLGFFPLLVLSQTYRWLTVSRSGVRKGKETGVEGEIYWKGLSKFMTALCVVMGVMLS